MCVPELPTPTSVMSRRRTSNPQWGRGTPRLALDTRYAAVRTDPPWWISLVRLTWYCLGRVTCPRAWSRCSTQPTINRCSHCISGREIKSLAPYKCEYRPGAWTSSDWYTAYQQQPALWSHLTSVPPMRSNLAEGFLLVSNSAIYRTQRRWAQFNYFIWYYCDKKFLSLISRLFMVQ